MSIRKKVLELTARETVDRYHPQFGAYTIRSISEKERADVEAENRLAMVGLSDDELDTKSIELGKRARVRLIIATVCEHGTNMLTFKPADLDQLMEVDSRVIDAIVQAVDDHVGYTPMSREEEARHLKNLSKINGASSLTVSPVTVGGST